MRETLNLPKTKFPMKGNLSQREPDILRFWQENKVYEKALEKNNSGPRFILHDGPPYANGDIHVGTAFNKVLKDTLVRHYTMRGYFSPYVPGWDCHGQPIEFEVEKRLEGRKDGISKVDFRKRCRDYAEHFLGRQRTQFRRLGVTGDWGKPYLTMEPSYESTIVEIFGALFQKNLIYQGKKPIYWCYHCQTALAEAEIEYKNKEAFSITVKFSLTKNPWGEDSVNLLVWTTTPWTLPANVAVALHPQADYVLVDCEGEKSVLVASLVEEVVSRQCRELRRFKGQELEGYEVVHPLFSDKTSKVIMATFVELGEGTGIVHIAPGHGEEDYQVGQEYELPVVMPVDDKGRFTAEAGKYQGKVVDEANAEIIKDLEDSHLLVKEEQLAHSYPHCWRCKKPVIFRATKQWFISMRNGNLREKALESIKKVTWYPSWSINRITSMVKERPDWCISRQRFWGVPLPIFYCQSCQQPVVNQQSIQAVAELFAREGSDAWFSHEASEILPSGFQCPHCGYGSFDKEKDIVDVWFESGVSHEAVLKKFDQLSWPATIYVEGSDQHRGWFQSSLLVSVGANERAPYEEVLTHGFTVDEKGRKMSKSLGNVVDPLEVVDELGADILRLWVASADYSSDVAVSPEILKRVAESYRRFRNTFRFLLGNLNDFSCSDEVDYEEMEEIDKWILHRLYKLIRQVNYYWKDYRIYLAVKQIHNFCTRELSAFYLDVLKDRLYTQAPSSPERRSAQTALWKVFLALVKMLAPVLVFTCEEAWQALPERLREKSLSVHLTDWPGVKNKLINPHLEERWEKLLGYRNQVLQSLERAREEKFIGNSLEAKVILKPSTEEEEAFLKEVAELLPMVFVVSQVKIGEVSEGDFGIEVARTDGVKCPRCWKYSLTVGQDSQFKRVCEPCAQALKQIGWKEEVK